MIERKRSRVAMLALMIVALPGSIASARMPGVSASPAGTYDLAGRRLQIGTPTSTPVAKGTIRVQVSVTVTNTGAHSFVVRPADFAILTSEGDIFGQSPTPTPATASLSGTIAPTVSGSGWLTFTLPTAAAAGATLLYAPVGQNIGATFPLALNSTSVPAAPTSSSSASIQEYPLAGGVGEPWGTAIDSSGNVWFAEAGCDIEQTCSSSTPPGQIGEFIPSTKSLHFYTLPNVSGNQPIFVVIDGSGNIWFTTPHNSMIGEFKLSSRSFAGQWKVTSGTGPWDLIIQNGAIWYTEHWASAVGRFNMTTHAYRDFPTPTASSNPYGIWGHDPLNSHLIWFTENNSSVARIAALDTSNSNKISEYLIRAQLSGVNLTPHAITVDASGNVWWTEGWVRAIGKLVPSQATPGQCGTSSGDCSGVTEYYLPGTPSTCNSSHVSGITRQGTSQLWVDDSLSAQVGSFSFATSQFTLYNLSNCNAHPHDGLDFRGNYHLWWDEEFANTLGELS